MMKTKYIIIIIIIIFKILIHIIIYVYNLNMLYKLLKLYLIALSHLNVFIVLLNN